MKIKLVPKKKASNGYIDCIKLGWWRPIVYYPLQLTHAIYTFMFNITPSWGLKSMIIDIQYTKPTKELERMGKIKQ